MKKVLVIGATGSLAHYVIEALKELENVHLTLFVRNKSKLQQSLVEGLTIFEGDAMDYNSVRRAIEGHDIVYVNLAGNLEESRCTKNNRYKLNRHL